MTRVLVTGGRYFADADMLARTMDRLHSLHGFTLLINGAANGADALAGEWADLHGIAVKDHRADWKQHGKAAGPIRNREMLKDSPQLVVAFPGGRGTADIVKAARQVGINVIEATHHDTSPVVAGINRYLNDRAPFDAFLAGAAERGLTITFDGWQNKLLVSPREKLTDADTAFIRKHREELVQALIMATPIVKTEFCSICPGKCPETQAGTCAGCPQEEYRNADGLIYSAWCRDGRDVGKPVEVRERGTENWKTILKT